MTENLFQLQAHIDFISIAMDAGERGNTKNSGYQYVLSYSHTTEKEKVRAGLVGVKIGMKICFCCQQKLCVCFRSQRML